MSGPVRVVIAPILFTVSCCAWFCGAAAGFQLTEEPPTSPRYQRYVAELMKRFDSNDNGMIDAEELVDAEGVIPVDADANEDGLISPGEILNYVVGSAQTGESGSLDDESSAGKPHEHATATNSFGPAIRVSVTVVKLPEEFAQSEAVALEDIANRINSGQVVSPEDGGGRGRGIQILDRFEFEAVEGMPCQLGSKGESEEVISKTLSLGNRGQVVQTQGVNFGSKLKVLPKYISDALTLSIDYDARFILPTTGAATQKPVAFELSLDTTLLFSGKSVSVLNVFSGGQHCLMLVSAVPTSRVD